MSEPWESPDIPEAAFSLTAKSGKGYDADMLTVRGQTWDDFHANLQAAFGPEITDAKLANLSKVPQDVQPQSSGGQSSGAASSGPAPSQSGDWKAQAPMCAHGQRNPREWTAKSGPQAGKQQYTYFCAAPRETPDSEKCKPVDALTGKEWGAK